MDDDDFFNDAFFEENGMGGMHYDPQDEMMLDELLMEDEDKNDGKQSKTDGKKDGINNAGAEAAGAEGTGAAQASPSPSPFEANPFDEDYNDYDVRNYDKYKDMSAVMSIGPDLRKGLKDEKDRTVWERLIFENMDRQSELVVDRPASLFDLERENMVLCKGLDRSQFCFKLDDAYLENDVRAEEDELIAHMEKSHPATSSTNTGLTPGPMLSQISDINSAGPIAGRHSIGGTTGTGIPKPSGGANSTFSLDSSILSSFFDGNYQKLELERREHFKKMELDQRKRCNEKRYLAAKQNKKAEVTKKAEGQLKTGHDKKGLWADRYAPSSYLDLVSDEKTNRQVLEWVGNIEKLNNGLIAQEQKKEEYKYGFGGFRKVEVADKNGAKEWTAGVDIDIPRILLLSGPPGIGKTTMARVLGRQRQYKVVETNCSEIRTATALVQRVKDVCGGDVDASDRKTKKKDVQMFENGVLLTEKQIWMRQNKPPMLVLDEIDGIAKGSSDGGAGNKVISALLKLIQADRKEADNCKWNVRSPIIAICNDLRSRSLIELRKYAFTVNIIGESGQSTIKKLKERLKHICRREKIGCNDGALLDLIRGCSADVRACVNSLQLLSASNRHIDNKVVREYLRRGNLKEKESQVLDLFKVVLEPHSIRDVMRKRVLKAKMMGQAITIPAYASRVLKLAYDFDFRMICQDFLAYLFGVSVRERAAKTGSAMERWSMGEELDRIGFRHNAWELKSNYALGVPLLHCAQSIAPESNDKRFQLSNAYETQRAYKVQDDKRLYTDALDKIKWHCLHVSVGTKEFGANQDNKPEAEDDNKKKKKKNNDVSASAAAQSALYFVLSSQPRGEGDGPSPYEPFETAARVQGYRRMTNMGSRDLAFLAETVCPEESKLWHAKNRSIESRFPEPRDQREMQPLETAVKLMADLGSRWKYDQWQSTLYLSPSLTQLALPYKDQFATPEEAPANLISFDDSWKEAQRRKDELRNNIYKKEEGFEVQKRVEIARYDLNHAYYEQKKQREEAKLKRKEAKRRASLASLKQSTGGKVAKKRRRTSMVNGVAFRLDEEKESWDMFKVAKKKDNRGEKPKFVLKQMPVWLNFFEGHSKAVYRPVQMSRFLSSDIVKIHDAGKQMEIGDEFGELYPEKVGELQLEQPVENKIDDSDMMRID